MWNHGLGRGMEDFHPPTRHAPWGDDYGTRDVVERERPFIEDTPLRHPGWETESRWGSRPDRERERDLERGWTIPRRILELGWAQILGAIRKRANS